VIESLENRIGAIDAEIAVSYFLNVSLLLCIARGIWSGVASLLYSAWMRTVCLLHHTHWKCSACATSQTEGRTAKSVAGASRVARDENQTQNTQTRLRL
jgi:hypothetical protein